MNPTLYTIAYPTCAPQDMQAIEAMTGIRVLHMPTELEALRRLAGSPPRKSP